MAQYSLDIDSQEHLQTAISLRLWYDHHQRTTKYDRAQNVNGEPGTQQHHTAAPITGCLAHSEIPTRSHKIKALYERIPSIPVHPSVYVSELAQLRDGVSFSNIRRKNQELFQAKAYKDLPHDLASSQFRWILTHNKSRSLYHQYNHMKGVTVTDAPEVNVNNWLDPQSEKYNPTLAHTIFHYSARAEKGERFKVAIATDKMNRAAWTYGHKSQIILDGTFGDCDSRLLLFIVIAVNEDRKGVPVAFLLFSSWRNHCNKLLKGKSGVMLDLKHCMASLEMALVATQTITEACDLLKAEREVMERLLMAY
ncbi:hypothetical protein B0H19DRAFT_1258869 [Mycena capillaripes]|nr:hypothetical protein B0H19DRAFT_1258869 [Mycena capillaripes]